MAENTRILWADHTFNPWYGCTKVGPGCDHCYAEDWAKRSGLVEWGVKAPRRLSNIVNWMRVLKWNEDARLHITTGPPIDSPHRIPFPRVFCCSLADVFDNAVPTWWRDCLWELIRRTPYLEWMLLTKRPQNIRKMLPPDWGQGYGNVGLMATICTQEEADRDIDHLVKVPAIWHGLSCEPLLEDIELLPWLRTAMINWVIAGGESGPKARVTHVNHYRSLRDQCLETATAFLFKQYGAWVPQSQLLKQAKPGARRILLDDGAGRREMHWRVPYKNEPPHLDGFPHVEFPRQEVIRDWSTCMTRLEKRQFSGRMEGLRNGIR